MLGYCIAYNTRNTPGQAKRKTNLSKDDAESVIETRLSEITSAYPKSRVHVEKFVTDVVTIYELYIDGEPFFRGAIYPETLQAAWPN
ncbi:MAG: hypothetical protein KDK71_06125 [Chlamydiia bacterium]|nr:hypothetical protein [Chlamydiia bacterium]